MKSWLKPSLNWLLPLVPLTIVLHFVSPEAHTLSFILSCIAIIPLAGMLGNATEKLAEKTGEGIGGLLNATFGNAAELIIAIMALRGGLTDVVKASLTGSIIGNILLVLGMSCLAGGIRFKKLNFNATAARSMSTMLTLAAIALFVPAAYHHLGSHETVLQEQHLSIWISLVLIVTYGLSLLFSLHTHKQLFVGDVAEVPQVEEGSAHREWPVFKSIGILLIAAFFVAWVSEILVGSVESAAHAFGMSNVFIGVIVVAIVGNAAEHSTAVMVAMKNRMDLSLGIAIGSSIQVALFVAPLMVLLSYLCHWPIMDLVFTPAEVIAIVLSVIVTGQIASDGESNWLEGVQLLSVYIILAIIFYLLPASPAVPLP